MWTPDYIVIHHSVTAATRRQAVGLAHDKKYHLLLVDLGSRVEIFQSVPDSEPSRYGTGCFNSRAYGVCLVGDFHQNVPSELLIHELIQAIVIKEKRLPGPQNVTFHQYVGQVLAACRYGTACPGQHVIARLPYIREQVAKRLQGLK